MMSKAMNWDKAGPGVGMCCSGLRNLNSGYGPIIHLITLSYLALRASPDLEDEQIFLLSWFRDRHHRKIFSSPPFLYWPTPEVLPHQNLLTFFAYLCILKLLFIYYVEVIVCVSLCVCMWVYACTIVDMLKLEDNFTESGSLILSCGTLKMNSSHQAWRQALLLTDPYPRPLFILLGEQIKRHHKAELSQS